MSNAASEEMYSRHVFVQVNWWTCCAGMCAKPPARSVTDVPSFIFTRASPLTIIRVSVGVCQCQGITHPVAAFARMIEGPLVGSPLCTEPVEQTGIPGICMKCMAPTFCPGEWLPLCAREVGAKDTTSRTSNEDPKYHRRDLFIVSPSGY